MWGGDQPGLPKVHTSERKLQLLSMVEVMHLSTGRWEQRTTTGNPPLGVKGYSSTVIGRSILFFGGSCNHDDCRHNSLHSLNIDSFAWSELSRTNSHYGPMMKAYCSMIAVQFDGEDYLLVVGGIGPSNNNTPHQVGAEYADKGLHEFVRTNEHHYYNLSTGKTYTISVINDGALCCND